MANIHELFGTTDTNEQIASLIEKQTFDERLAMATWLCSVSELTDNYYAFAAVIGDWADNIIAEKEEPIND